MLELKEDREIVRGIIEYLEKKYNNMKNVSIEQGSNKYNIKVETEDDRSILDSYTRTTDRNIKKCGILYHVKNKDITVNFI